jgi:FKBP-type peptidyl-prolyl cis-trans isomerase FkpA
LKKLLCVGLLLLAASLAFADGIAEEAAAGNSRADMSYAFGMYFASDLKQAKIDFNYRAFIQGFSDIMEGRDPRFTMLDAEQKVEAAYNTAMAAIAEENRVKEEAFLEGNGKLEGVVTTASGLQYEVLKEGEGDKPGDDDIVTVNYKGAFLDGSIFDSSYDRGGPDQMPLRGVIPGWSEGLKLMQTGSKYRLYVPSKLAYGSRGAGGAIPPNATLVYEVELLGIEKGAPGEGGASGE